MANTTTYNPKSIEPKWQKYWEEHGTFKTDVWDFSKPKYYALDMFPYPSERSSCRSQRIYSYRYHFTYEENAGIQCTSSNGI